MAAAAAWCGGGGGARGCTGSRVMAAWAELRGLGWGRMAGVAG